MERNFPDLEDSPELAPGRRQAYTILVVDDDVDLLDLMERLLGAQYNVLRAQSPRKALELLRTNAVHLLITDQYMPGMTGVELLAAAKAEKPEVARLLITGQADLKDLIAGANAGEVQYYLTKPWDMEAMLAAVENAASAHRLSDENRRLAQPIQPAGAALNERLTQLPQNQAERRAAESRSEAQTNRGDQLAANRTRDLQAANAQPGLEITRRQRTEAAVEVSVEGLRAAEAELRRQNDELLVSQQRLEAEHQRYRTLFELAPDGYLVTDGAGLIQEANVAAGRLLNTSKESLVGMPLSSFLPAAAQRDFERWLTQLSRLGPAAAVEFQVVPPGAEPFSAAISLAIDQDDQRQIVSLRWLLRKIGERQQAPVQAPKSAEPYQFLVDHLPAGLLVYAADTRVALSNPRVSELLGLSQAQMLGRPMADPMWGFLREDASPLPADEYPARRAIATRQPVSNQVVGIRRQTTGDLVWMLAHAFPDFDAQGRIQQTVVMFIDISRRKQTEAALQASEAQYRELYRSAQRQAQEMALLDRVRAVVAGELDVATVIRKVVDTIAETFGYPLVSLYLRQGEALVLQHQVGYEKSIKEIPVSKAVLDKVMRTGRLVLLGDFSTDPDLLKSTPGVTSGACVPLFDRSQAVGALNVETQGVAFNETDLQLLTALAGQIGIALGRAWLYTQVREDASTKAVLLHEVDHRVKNNLSGIIGLLQLQQDYLPAEVHSALQTLFDDLIGRIRSLAAVHDLLSAAAWAPLPVHDLADRIVQTAIAAASPHPDVSIDIPESEVKVTSKQAAPLALIINELATNSLKYALPKTAALCLSLQVKQAARLITLEYRDNGPGFPPDVLRGERESVGLHLVRLLTRHDLRGKIDLSNSHGAVARLSFGAGPTGGLTPSPTGPLSISGQSS